MAVRIPLLLAVILFVPVAGCKAQVPDAGRQIAEAVSPLPEDLRAGAAVMGYTADGTLVPIREGTNDLICLADKPGDEGFHAACYHKALEPYMARGRELRAEGADGAQSLEIRHKEADAGTLKMPDVPAAVYNRYGKSYDPETDTVEDEGRLYAVYMPYATGETTGLPMRPAGPGAPWIMRPGTASAHIMISPPPAN